MLTPSAASPWKRGSSSACHPTEASPSAYKFKLHAFGQSPAAVMPHKGMTTESNDNIQGGKSEGATLIPPYLYAQLQLKAVNQAVLRGIFPKWLYGCIHDVLFRMISNQASLAARPRAFGR
jgi:hypothetical protein